MIRTGSVTNEAKETQTAGTEPDLRWPPGGAEMGQRPGEWRGISIAKEFRKGHPGRVVPCSRCTDRRKSGCSESAEQKWGQMRMAWNTAQRTSHFQQVTRCKTHILSLKVYTIVVEWIYHKMLHSFNICLLRSGGLEKLNWAQLQQKPGLLIRCWEGLWSLTLIKATTWSL